MSSSNENNGIQSAVAALMNRYGANDTSDQHEQARPEVEKHQELPVKNLPEEKEKTKPDNVIISVVMSRDVHFAMQDKLHEIKRTGAKVKQVDVIRDAMRTFALGKDLKCKNEHRFLIPPQDAEFKRIGETPYCFCPICAEKTDI